MRPRNLPDGGYDKVILMCSRDLLTRRRENATPRRGGHVVDTNFNAVISLIRFLITELKKTKNISSIMVF